MWAIFQAKHCVPVFEINHLLPHKQPHLTISTCCLRGLLHVRGVSIHVLSREVLFKTLTDSYGALTNDLLSIDLSIHQVQGRINRANFLFQEAADEIKSSFFFFFFRWILEWLKDGLREGKEFNPVFGLDCIFGNLHTIPPSEQI